VEARNTATASVGLLISNKLTKNVKDTFYVNERVLRVVLDIGKDKIHLLNVYARDANKTKEEMDTFYEHLQDEIEEKILIMGDLNASDKTKETRSQRICNSNNYPGQGMDKLLQTNVRRR